MTKYSLATSYKFALTIKDVSLYILSLYILNGLASLPASAQLLSTGEALKFSAFYAGSSNGVTIEVPTPAPGDLETKGQTFMA